MKFEAFDISNMLILILMSTIVLWNTYRLLGRSWCQNQKYSEFIEIWPNWYFKYADFDFTVKNNFHKIFTTWFNHSGPKIKIAQNLLKFGIYDILNMLTSILMSKIVLKYQNRKIKILEILSNMNFWGILILGLFWSDRLFWH